MHKHDFSHRSVSGFTVTELLVGVAVTGILAAIAAPSWLAYLNNQKVNLVRNQLSDAIRTAQTEAKRTKINREVVFDNNSGNPRVAIVPNLSVSKTRITLSAIQNWQPLGDGQISANTVTLTTQNPASPAPASIIFDPNGHVLNTGLPYKVTIGLSNGSNHKRCTIVETLLGSIQEGADNGDVNTNTPSCN